MPNTDRSLVATIDPGNFSDQEVEVQSVEELEDEIAELCAHIDAATYRRGSRGMDVEGVLKGGFF